MSKYDLLPFILYWCDDEYRNLDTGGPPAVEKTAFPQLLTLARKNKLSYFLARKIIEDGYLSDRIFTEAREEGERNLTKQQETLAFLNSMLGEKGIDFLVIKSFKDLPYYTFDIDIMVREHHFHLAVETLHAHGFRPVVAKRRVPLPDLGSPGSLQCRGCLLGRLDVDYLSRVTIESFACGLPSIVPDRIVILNVTKAITQSMSCDRIMIGTDNA